MAGSPGGDSDNPVVLVAFVAVFSDIILAACFWRFIGDTIKNETSIFHLIVDFGDVQTLCRGV